MLTFEKSIGQFQAAHNKTLYTIRAVVNGIELQYMNIGTGDTGTFVFATVQEAIETANEIARANATTAEPKPSNEAGQ
jgi:pyridoxine 5'-phosphate synthase PdxJ